ncbi:hypothetical protein [Candidatus Marinarcus aquaticus]|uniref:Uncharacterized protein n=1 Tax=Candidatus Marinarcus aquaticus TaxID=2044504 RepID=A0A4Q0XU19_9BACT|nr:hypothetical protein [Candidatus Marinarcus aquaticus]RXJ60902.1 hypothetical protein CRV04_02500 [Candidatus Marinarcus aquaticus]
MITAALEGITQQIEALIHKNTDVNYENIKTDVEMILSDVEIFNVDNKLDAKAVDLYVKKVITQRNSLLKQQEQMKIENSKASKYALIESICQQYEFQTKEELLQTIEQLEKKSMSELTDLCNSFNTL